METTIKKTISQELKVTEFPFIRKDSKGNMIYYEDNEGYWWKKEFDSKGNIIYHENSSSGVIRDNRRQTKPNTIKEEETLKEITAKIQDECHKFVEATMTSEITYQDATNTFIFMKLAELTMKLK